MMTMSMNTSSSSVQVQMQVAVPFHFEKCQSMSQLRQYHSQIIRLGLSSHNHLIPPLINFCARASTSDALTYALKLFDSIPQPDAFLYNTIIKGFLHSQLLPSNSILLLYSHMLQNSVLPNNFTFPSLLRACRKIQHGLQIHAHLFKFGFGAHSVCLNSLIHMYVTFQALEEARRVFHTIPHPDSVSWTSLISGYSKWGLIDEAFSIFQLMPQKNSASWNAMMAAYVQTNRFHEAFALFDRMKAENNNVLDKFVATTMLSACTGLGALEQGKWIHEYIKRNGIELDSKLATAIVDMYCKCGCLEKALQVFHSLPLRCRWISSWNCMIGGLAMHGNGEAAIQLFKEMERQMVVPDDITFLNLLTACAHSGLVEEGRNYFSYMIRVYGIEPRMEHFGCMVDLLGRAGMVQEARKLIDEMPVSPDVTVLGTLLGACKKHRNIELGEEIGRRVIELEPNNSGRYVLLANLYANAGKWEDVAKVRKLMDDRGVKKAPGFSMIELQGTVHEFIAGERNHPQAKELHAKVYEMLENLKSVGYVADTNGVLHGHDFDEEDGENPLYYHPVCEKSSPVFVNSSNPTKPLQSNTNLVNSLGGSSLKIGVSKMVAKNEEIKNRDEKKIDMEIEEIEREIKRLSSRLEALRLEKVERNTSKTIEKRGRIVAAKFMDQKQSVKIEEPLIPSSKSKINRRGVSLGPSEILSGSKSRLFCGKQDMNTPVSIQNRRKSCFWKLEEIDELKATKERGKSLSVSPRSRKNVSKIQFPKQAVTTVGSRRSVKKEDGIIASIQPKNLFKDGEKSVTNKKPLKPGRVVASRYSQIGTNQSNGNLSASDARKRSLPDNEKEDVNKRRASRGDGACQRMDSGRVKKKWEIPIEVVVYKGDDEGESPPTVSTVADVLPKIRTVRCVAETPRDSGAAKRVADLAGKKPYFCIEEAEAGDSFCQALSFAGEDGEE